MVGTSKDEILVSPEILAEKAGTVEQRIVAVEREYSRIEIHIKNMGGYWQGEAADGFRLSFGEKKEELDHILARFRENVEKLKEIAGIYGEAESAAAEEVGELPSDILL